MRKIILCVLISFLVVFSLSANGTTEEQYPSKAIRIIVPWAPGGLGPVMIEMLKPILSEKLGVPIIAENKPGGGTSVGMKELQEANPDGYTIGVESASIFGVTHTTKGAVDYKKFEPIVSLTEDYFAITVNSDSQWKTFPEFYAYVKAHPKEVRTGNSGTGGTWHVAALAFNKEANVELLPVPFQGGGNAVTALLGNHIDATSVSIGDMTNVLDTGKLRILALGAPKRDSYFSDISTIKESIGKDISLGNFRGIIAPVGTPIERIEILEKAFTEVSKDPRYIAFLEKNKITNDFLGREEFTKKYNSYGERMMPILASTMEK